MTCVHAKAWWVRDVPGMTNDHLVSMEDGQRQNHRNPSKRTERGWNDQVHYNMSVRRELRKRGLLNATEVYPKGGG